MIINTTETFLALVSCPPADPVDIVDPEPLAGSKLVESVLDVPSRPTWWVCDENWSYW